MIFVNKSAFTSEVFNIGLGAFLDCYLAISGSGTVTIEQLGGDGVWRSYPETTFTGSGAYIVSLRGADTRIKITDSTTVEFTF